MDYNPLDPDVIDDPYPVYARLRREAPVCRTPLGFLAVSRYRDVLLALRTPELFSSSAMNDLIEGVKAQAPDAERIRGGQTLLGTDPPAHTRLRRIVNRAFTPRRVAALEPRVREIAERLVGEFAGTGKGDLMASLAVPLPVIVIAEMLGIDPDRRADFKRWSELFLEATAGISSDDRRAAIARSFEERAAYLEEVVESRRRSPRDDVISALVRAEQDEEVMSEQEVGNFIVLLLVAGDETTTNLIGNAVLTLREHLDVLRAVTRDRSLVSDLVEEVLRYDAPVQLTLRRTTDEVELSGSRVAKGEVVALLLGSANRDETVFESPDWLRLSRDGPSHVAFGFGTHFCIGAHLARLEARVALETLLSRLGTFGLRDRDVERAPSLFTRGPRRLLLEFPG
jgi:cytochrome P450